MSLEPAELVMPRRIRTIGVAACLAGFAVVLAPIANAAEVDNTGSPPTSVVGAALEAPGTDPVDELDEGSSSGDPVDAVDDVEETDGDEAAVDATDATDEPATEEPATEDVASAPAAVFEPFAVLGVTTTADTADVAPGDGTCADADGACSLRAAVQEANALAGPDTISLDAATYALTVSGAAEDGAATGDLDVTGDLTLTGASGTTIDAGALGDRIFDVRPGATLRLAGLELTGGTAADVATASGGAVLNGAVLEATDVVITGNQANRAGGGVEATAGSTTTLLRVTLSDNEAGPTPGNGGGLHLTGAGTVTVTDSVVTGNSATNEGGGLWNSSAGTMTVSGTEISGNEAAGALATTGGGGIFNQPNADGTAGGTLTVSDSSIAGNAATGAAGSGGGLFNSRGVVTITGTTFEGNSAPRAGGGIEALAGTTSITDTDFIDNRTGANPGNGGAVHLTGAGRVDITGGTAQGNQAANEGGAFWNSAVGTMTITDTDIVGNRADGDAFTAPDFEGGGGVFNDGATSDAGVSSGGTLTITGGRIADNLAPTGSGSGGGVLNVFGTLTISGTEISGNQAARAGGGIEANAGTTTLDGVFLSANAAGPRPGNGGAFHLTGPGLVTVNQSVVVGNSATNEGGGLWVSATGRMVVTRTLVAANTAQGTAEGSGGGGLYNDGGTLEASDTVVAGNEAQAGGGVLAPNGGTTTLTHVTVTGNEAATGAGVDSAAGTTLANSIVGDNVGEDCSGAIESAGGNVVGTCTLDGPGDVTGVTDFGLDGDLVPAPGSPAIDTGLVANATPVDLVGTVRPLDGDGDGVALPDAGALEAAAVTPVTPVDPPVAPPVDPPVVDGAGQGGGRPDRGHAVQRHPALHGHRRRPPPHPGGDRAGRSGCRRRPRPPASARSRLAVRFLVARWLSPICARGSLWP